MYGGCPYIHAIWTYGKSQNDIGHCHRGTTCSISMETRKTIISLSIGSIFASIAPSALAQCIPAATIESLRGHVQYRQPDANQWLSAQLNQQLCEQDRIRTQEQARTSLRLANETLVQLGEKTHLTLTSVAPEKETSILDLLEGLIHTLSRVPRSLDIKTPYVNASIEGTEFIVTHAPDDSKVAVVEGKVRVANKQGSALLSANEAATVQANQAPQKQLQINPLDGVAWEINYLPVTSLDQAKLTDVESRAWANYQNNRPDLALKTLTPVIETGKATDNALLIVAAAYLQLGQADKAQERLSTLSDDNESALALKAITAIAENQLLQAEQLLENAATDGDRSADLSLALSYLQQAKHQLTEALATTKTAHKQYPDNALVAARLSELHLMADNPAKAEKLAANALEKAPGNSQLMTALGFAQLHNGKTKKAQATFTKALTQNSTDSLNHLGLGLSKIKQGELEKGREHLETAVLLAPRYSLLRSYLAKAYFEEIRNPLVYDQLELAKQDDPADPTPWLYEAITLHDDNRAIEALQSMEKSIELNDNRAVYRSELLLDDDRSSRVAAIGSIYHALGFNQLALTPATNSLAVAPTNANAHRLLADSYVGQHHQDLARINELHTARLLAPVSDEAIPGNLLRSHSTLLERSNPLIGGYKEHGHLFSQSGTYGHLELSAGSLDTYSSDLTAGLIDDNTSLHASLHTLSTDGEHSNNDYETTAGNIEFKWDVTSKLRLTLLHDEDETQKGVPSQQYFFSPVSSGGSRVETESDTDAIGFQYQYSPANQFIGRISRSDSGALTIANANLMADVDYSARKTELQWAHSSQIGQWLTGAEHNNADFTSTVMISALPAPIINESKLDEDVLYSYLTSTNRKHGLTTTFGLEHKKAYNASTQKPDSRTLPKLGIKWAINHQWNLGLAYFESMAPTTSLTAHLSLQPTQIAGFNQIHRGTPAAHGKSKGISLEWKHSPRLTGGVRYLSRDNSNEEGFTKVINGSPVDEFETIENRVDNKNAWLYWSLNDRLSLALEHQYDTFSDDYEHLTGSTSDGLEELKTHRSPITLTYHPTERLSASWVNTYVQQKGIFWKNPTTPFDSATIEHGDESFWLMDAFLSYRLPKRRGQWTVGVKNLLGEDYRYEDYNSYDPLLASRTWVPSDYTKDRFWFTSLSLKF